jgi:hypothetical protein
MLRQPRVHRDRFSRLNLSPEGDDSGVVFIGMMHTILVESSDEGGMALGEGGISGSLVPEGATW